MLIRMALVALVTSLVVATAYTLVGQLAAGQQIPFGLQTFFWIAVFTLIIDLIDLRTQIGSFAFVNSLNYAAYYVMRLILGGLAATLIAGSGGTSDAFALGFLAVLTGFTILQNFAVSFGGQDLVDISALFDGYRVAMIKDEAKRISRQEAARTIALANELVQRLPTDVLSDELSTMISVSVGVEQARSRLKELGDLCAGNDALLRRAVAAEMVQLNPDYVRAYKDTWYDRKPPN